jgi:RNA polymerase sigma-54 factor
MKHSLQLKLSQHLTLTPQLQQSIRLLQLSTLDLNQEIEHFLMDNPLLERVEVASTEAVPLAPPTLVPSSEAASSATAGESEEHDNANHSNGSEPGDWENSGDWGQEGGGSSNRRDDDDEGGYPELQAATENLQQHLLNQLNLTKLSDRDKQLVAVLIGSLDEDGYLTQPLDEILQTLPPELEFELEELSIALKHVQNFDPIGVGARGLSECLLLQLAALPADTAYRSEATAIVRDYLELLGARDFTRLKKLLGLTDSQLKCAQQLITNLNPRPGGEYTPLDTRYIVPDVNVRKLRGKWIVALNNDAIPKLRINKMYADILSRSRDSSSSQLSSRLQEARWLIKNVQQRFETILKVSQAIVDRQRHFFDHGEVAMRPLVLREIADAVGVHESTVSRVTTQKFMFTPRGIFELKYFFGSHVSTETGGAASSTAIRALIKQLVSAEDTKKPLSDSRISNILSQQGIVVARRTVAKYRESLQISPANLRKSL